QDGEFCFSSTWQPLNTQEINEEANRQTIHQPYEAQEKQAERQLIQKLQVKIKQLEAEAQQ
ncbi:5460_t:CDS:1, partial [Entrophospora sp. SA101]